MSKSVNINFDTTPCWGEETVITYGRQRGYREAGVCGLLRHTNYLVLFGLNDLDIDLVSSSNLEPSDIAFRYATRNTIAAGLMPLCLINVESESLFFLTQRSFTDACDQPVFDRRRSKVGFIRFLKDANVYGKRDSEETV
ncbi:hypothetical protein N9L75_03790 [Porticoccaceae bacterium]|nr:hypothetical protein [Porticoccaceae bacterium]MDA8651678.1 hypothetical protein [Porticoccaceae bacterium]MDA8682073.1 hypothetical protein [Porticoccaceae bacterium]MDB2343091.1 hypothetical protein [Porticoccaceae bacterium]MDB2486878.1 hypothetical protein [Porticoccaceae bacterium]